VGQERLERTIFRRWYSTCLDKPRWGDRKHHAWIVVFTNFERLRCSGCSV